VNSDHAFGIPTAVQQGGESCTQLMHQDGPAPSDEMLEVEAYLEREKVGLYVTGDWCDLTPYIYEPTASPLPVTNVQMKYAIHTENGNVEHSCWTPLYRAWSSNSSMDAFARAALMDMGISVENKVFYSYGHAVMDHTNTVRSIMGYDRPDPPMADPAIFNQYRPAFEFATRALRTIMGRFMKPSVVRPVYTVINDMPKTTSPGFPYKLQWRESQDAMAEAIKHARVVWDDFSADNDVDWRRHRFWWNFFPKDELLKQQKIVEGKTRGIAGAPLHLNIVMRQLFSHQNQLLKDTHMFHPAKIGISKYELGLHSMLHDLQADGGTWHMDDVVNWDKGLWRWWFWEVAKFRHWCLETGDSEHDAKLWRLVSRVYAHIIDSEYILPTGEVVWVHNGQESGSPNTSEDNCLINIMRTAAEWAMNRMENSMPLAMEEFIYEVSMAVYGDDRLCVYRGSAEITLKISDISRYDQIMGFQCPPEKARRNSTPEGQEFIGCTFKRYGKYWVPVGRSARGVASLLQAQATPKTEAESLARLIGLYYDYFWCTDPEPALQGRSLRDVLEEILRRKADVRVTSRDLSCTKHIPVPVSLLMTIPQRWEVERLYLGFESGSDGSGTRPVPETLSSAQEGRKAASEAAKSGDRRRGYDAEDSASCRPASHDLPFPSLH